MCARRTCPTATTGGDPAAKGDTSMVRAIVSLFLALACVCAIPQARAVDPPQDPPTLQDIEARVRRLETLLGETTQQTPADLASLDQRLRVLEQKLAAQPAIVAATPPPPAKEVEPVESPSFTFDDKGLAWKSSIGGGSELRLRGLFQYDGRQWFDDGDVQDDTFLLRRAEPTIEGNFGELLAYRFTGQFAGDSASTVDAYLDVRLDPRATVRLGKTKVPLGLERLQSSATTSQVENGLPSELAPGRDIGVQLQGKFDGPGLSYALGVYNGTVDGRDGASTNPDGDFEVAARVFFEPWKGGDTALSGLGFGLAATHGDKTGSGNDFLPRYRTPGQVTFFSYRNDVAAAGTHDRWSPQMYWYVGRFGVLGEYIASRQEVARNGVGDAIDNRAWQISTSFAVTGEPVGYQGITKPDNPFALGESGWGALELTARYGELDIDDRAFPVFANPASAADGARSWGVGFNWYLNAHFKLVADYLHTTFDAAPDGIRRDAEHILLTRAQFSF
ncbi:porin [Lysobacter sp. HX-5-24]|uniref:Porin n=2 Tax=Noviluteimonas gilva TaxID=2682097 RepID=A0A7C9I5B4_9GAMM|nr:porin [Lysobacter gilvus]